MSQAAQVLIVDDDEDVRHVLRVLFDTYDFQVIAEAGDGPNAVALALRHQPDFIVLDYMMPGMTGDKVAVQLRATSPESRIVAFSAMLQRKPEWADAFLNKTRMVEVAPLIESLLPN